MATYYSYMEPYGDANYLIGNPPNAYQVQMNSNATTRGGLAQGRSAGGLTENSKMPTGIQFTSYQTKPDQS